MERSVDYAWLSAMIAAGNFHVFFRRKYAKKMQDRNSQS
jgi:hypothetical protein